MWQKKKKNSFHNRSNNVGLYLKQSFHLSKPINLGCSNQTFSYQQSDFKNISHKINPLLNGSLAYISEGALKVPFKIWMAAPVLEGPIPNKISAFHISNMGYSLPLIMGFHLMYFKVAYVMSNHCDQNSFLRKAKNERTE